MPPISSPDESPVIAVMVNVMRNLDRVVAIADRATFHSNVTGTKGTSHRARIACVGRLHGHKANETPSRPQERAT